MFSEPYSEVYERLKASVDNGSADAAYEIGMLFEYHFRGPDTDREKFVLHYYQKAADLGSASAFHSLGNLYRDGKGVPKDTQRAIGFYKQAAATGYAYAMTALGRIYEGSEGVFPDLKQALQWWLMAAEAGDEYGKLNAGRAYLRGRGTRIDADAGWHWLEPLTEGRGFAATEAKKELAAFEYRHGEPEEGRYWLTLAADSGDFDATVELITRLRDQGVSIDAYEEAYRGAKRFNKDFEKRRHLMGMLDAIGATIPREDREMAARTAREDRVPGTK